MSYFQSSSSFFLSFGYLLINGWLGMILFGNMDQGRHIQTQHSKVFWDSNTAPYYTKLVFFYFIFFNYCFYAFILLLLFLCVFIFHKYILYAYIFVNVL